MPEIPPPPNSFKHKDDEGYFTIPWQQWYLKLHAAAAALVNLASGVTGRLPYSHFTQASAASKLLGRGSAAGAGDWQEISLGANLAMTGTTLAATASTPGGVSGDVQYNNAGVFAGSVLKQPASDVIEQVDGTTTQTYRFYNTVSGGGANYERLALDVEADFFSESAFTFEAEKAGTGGNQGIQFRSPGSISFVIPGANPVLVLYHDPTSNGGINLVPNGSGSVGAIVCDQSGSWMLTPGGYGSPLMIEIPATTVNALLIGTGSAGADFGLRFLTFDSSSALRQVSIGNATGLAAKTSGTVFVLDAAINGDVANLPAAPPMGSQLYVTTALAPVIGSAVVGGGLAFAAVMWNGAQWTVFSV